MKLSFTATTLLLIMLLRGQSAVAQPFEDAGKYMDYISKANEDLTATYLSYLSAAAHGKSHRKVEKRRQDVINAIYNTRTSIQGMPPWKGDKGYRDTTVAFLKIVNIVFNEDYAKIVNMEDIAEQSYDAMEAYLLAQEKADEKLEEARQRQADMSKKFAAKYNINLIEGESETGKKGKIAGEVNKHYNDVYLIFFKPYKQDMYLVDALGKGNMVAIEQNINSLGKAAKDGQEKLKAMTGYNNDPVLIEACNQAMDFYKSEAERSSALSDFFLKKEKFDKLKKTFDAKRQKDRTQADIDEFNKGVNDINAASKDYNDLNQQLNKERNNMLNNWNKKVSHYFDDYMPVQRKQ
jgi:chemotaxis protein histidine kinase CheA